MSDTEDEKRLHRNKIKQEWRAKNKDKIKEGSRVYYEKNKKVIIEKVRKYQEDPEKLRKLRAQRQRTWRANNNEKVKEKEHSDKNRFNTYKRNAKQRDLPFEISLEYACELFVMPCHYCNKCKAKGKPMGIDRKDNSLGYIEDNCLPCCGICNKMKHVIGYNDFLENVRAIYTNFNQA